MMGVLVDGRVGALGVGIGMRVEIGLLDLGTCPWGAKLFVDHLDGGVKGCGRRLILAGAFEGRWWRMKSQGNSQAPILLLKRAAAETVGWAYVQRGA
jgi:hypothetical protein